MTADMETGTAADIGREGYWQRRILTEKDIGREKYWQRKILAEKDIGMI